MTNYFTFGEIMLRLSPPQTLKMVQTDTFNIGFAGSEANVAVSLSSFQEPVQYITFLAENDLGKKTYNELRKYGVGTDFIEFSNFRQGVLFVEKGSMLRPSTVIYDRMNSAFANIQPNTIDWNNIFRRADWFHWSGITPALSENLYNIILESLVIARDLGVTVSVDLNYRKNLWNHSINVQDAMTKLVEYCDVLIGNEEDAENCLGITADPTVCFDDPKSSGLSIEYYTSLCNRISHRFPHLQAICFSLREAMNANRNYWSGILFNQDGCFASTRYKLTDIVDRVGAGDSFAAGIIYGLNNFNNDFQKVIDFATASSALKHSIEGDFNLVTLKDVEQIISGNTHGRIQR